MVSEISSSEYAIDDTLSRLRNLAELAARLLEYRRGKAWESLIRAVFLIKRKVKRLRTAKIRNNQEKSNTCENDLRATPIGFNPPARYSNRFLTDLRAAPIGLGVDNSPVARCSNRFC